ncbi:MAG: response regulator transcription factor [Leifsonia sp.]|jgi:DNA-binding response OmpR family regulator
MSRILIAEDEPRIASFVEKGLRSAGFTVTTVTDGLAALDEVRTGAHDLLVLDIGLPGLDGFGVLEAVRGEGHPLVVIVLTARTGGRDVVGSLEGGADDYLAKPFRFDELLARIRLRLKAARPEAADVLRAGDLVLDVRTRRITVSGTAVDLSAREFALAEELLTHAGQVLSREQLLSRVWGLDFDPGSNVVDVYVRYLRGKIGAERIETVRGMGYRLIA